jgi:hypothetical protein
MTSIIAIGASFFMWLSGGRILDGPIPKEGMSFVASSCNLPFPHFPPRFDKKRWKRYYVD